MAETRRKTPPQRVLAAAIIAVLMHGLVGSALVLSGAFEHVVPVAMHRTDEPPINLDSDGPPMEIESLVQTLDRPDKPTAEEQRRKQEEETTRADGQVVDIAKPAIEVRPDKANYLAEYDSKTAHETKGKTGRDKAGAAAPPSPPPQPAPQPPGREGMPGPQRAQAPRPAVAPSDAQPPRELAADGTMSPRLGAAQSPLPEQRGGGGRPGGRPNLLSQEALSRALGLGAGSMDYLKDVDEGESTALSAKKWKFASFFNRLKRSVGDEWHPETVYVRHDPSGNIYGVKDRVTVLRVHLLPTGKVANVEVVRGSGVDFLDDEAASAFRRAQPFLNPPPQLVEGDGQIHFNFAFIFELSGKASFKVFKY